MFEDTNSLPLYFSRLEIKSFIAGDMILYQGEVPRSVYVVKSGIVKVYSISKNGEERIVDFVTTGELIANSWVYGNTTSSIYYYQALNDCKLYSVPKLDYRAYIEIPENTKKALKHTEALYTASLVRITALEQAKARDKILFTMYYLVKRFGKKIDADWSLIQISLTHQMIADLVGLTRETTAVELHEIKKTKVLSYRKQKYIVHVGRLLKAIDEDTFASVVI